MVYLFSKFHENSLITLSVNTCQNISLLDCKPVLQVTNAVVLAEWHCQTFGVIASYIIRNHFLYNAVWQFSP